MRNQPTKIYTRKGDFGTTSLRDKSKIDKDHPRVECYGTIDELNSAIGLILIEQHLPNQIVILLTEIQRRLFDIGGELASHDLTIITNDDVTQLEKNIDVLSKDLPPLKDFILPQGTHSATACHLARTICRRAERRVVTLKKIESINQETLKYINRLSDFLFVVSRTLNHHFNQPEVLWKSSTF